MGHILYHASRLWLRLGTGPLQAFLIGGATKSGTHKSVAGVGAITQKLSGYVLGII